MKTYSTEMREKMILLLAKERWVTYEKQNLTRSRPNFYTLMNNLSKCFPRLCRKHKQGSHVTYESTTACELLARFVERIRVVEDAKGKGILRDN